MRQKHYDQRVAFLRRYSEYEYDDILGRVYSCNRCGSFVKDTVAHDAWHSTQNERP